MKALLLAPAARSTSIQELPSPTPGNGEILIRIHAVALNPVDALYVFHPIATQDQRVIGTDFAGVVAGIGPDLIDCPDLRTKVGTRVAGFHQGASSCNDRPGAFAEYITARYDLVWNVPSSLSLEAASTISMCGLTAALGAFAHLGLPCPFGSGSSISQDQGLAAIINVLIYGSSTSLGLYAAQLVHLSSRVSGQRIRLIGIASPSRHDLLHHTPYNYDVLVDYRDPQMVDKIWEATNGRGIDYAMDCISERETVQKIDRSLGPRGRMVVFRTAQGGQYDVSKLRVKPFYCIVWVGLGVEVEYEESIIPAEPDMREFATKFFSFLSASTSERGIVIEPNPVRIMPGGLERIAPDGLALLGSNMLSERLNLGRKEEYMRPVSAEKLVYRII